MEESRFWTKGKIILGIVILIVIAGIVGLIFLNRARLKKEYIKLENQITNQSAPNYLLYEQIELDDDEYRKINIKSMLKDNLITNKRVNDCDGYVIAENNNGSINYKTYLKCKKIYITEGYGTTVTSKTKKQNKTKTQTEKDTIKPVITLLGTKTVTIGVKEKYKDAGATATDNIDGDITKKIKVTNKVNTSKIGTYIVKYSVTDKAGNTATKKRTVIVEENKEKEDNKDKVVPVITFKNTSSYQKICIGDKVDISKDGLYGYTAHDDVDGDITSEVKITGPTGNATSAGEYTLNYSIKDKAGNESTASRKYSVVSCSAPAPSNPTPAPSNPTPAPSNPTPAPSNPTPSTPSTPSGGGSSSGGSSNTNVIIKPTGISAPNSVTVGVGQNVSLNASVVPSNATNKVLSYRTENAAIATVDAGGSVRGVKSGTTRVIISTSNGKFKSVTVTVR